METEEWRDVVGYEGYYMVSNLGKVKRIYNDVLRSGLTKNILKPKTTKLGRLTVVLCVNNKRKDVFVHTLVLSAFVGPKPDGMVCCHHDDICTNNNISNLRWDTQSNNIKDCIRNGKILKGEKVGTSILTNSQVVEIKKMLYKGNMSNEEIAKIFNIKSYIVSGIKTNRAWKHIEV